ncbi:MAG: Flp pilus assembly protein CpaB [Phycisphaerae bacterium]|nr:Flp pilus assembly protein CpaB [Phycisphaerae bacterium]
MAGKLPLLGIVGFGLFAAICAAVLMAVMRIEPSSAGAESAAPTTAPVVVAARDIEALVRITEEDLEVRDVPLTEALEDGFEDGVSLIGRVLSTPLLKGQALRDSVLLDEEAGAKLALALPTGYRAVSIELAGSSALRGLLYPGSRVDVLSSTRDNPEGQLLIQNVRVLAVGDKSLYADAPDEGEDEEDAAAMLRRKQDARSLSVTLMVDPDQSRRLQSARERGSLSLSLRNPLDVTTAEIEQPLDPVDSLAPKEAVEPTEPSRWRIRVVRGGSVSIREFDGAETGAVLEVDDDPSRPANQVPRPSPFDDEPSGEDE